MAGCPDRGAVPRKRPACQRPAGWPGRVRNSSGAFYAAAGSFVFLPRGRPHGFWAPGRPAWLALIAVPDGIEDYFRKFIATATVTGSASLRHPRSLRISRCRPGRARHPADHALAARLECGLQAN